MLAVLPLVAVAQQMPLTFEQLQKQYSSRDGFTVVRITSEMLRLSGMDDIANVSDIRILTAESYSEEFVNQMARVTFQADYKLLTAIEEKDQKARFFLRKTPQGRISDLVMITWGLSNNLIMSIRGDFSTSQIRSIANQVSPVKPVLTSDVK